MKIKYRPEIDGLRGIAVVAVIFYHAQITILGDQLFRGGFIGVDIFFVISGYLITSIILKELVTTGTFSFKHFYERRVRRILPVLSFVMLVSLPFAWLYLLPSSIVDFSKSILYSLGFSSNFYFHYSSLQYGAEEGLLIPFLHTWSLSVEEQYYILFPIVLLITFKYFRKYLLYILLLGFVISLGLADWGSKNYPSATFYFLHTRMWELLTGSLLAYFEIHLGHRSKHQTLNLILPSLGLFLIGHSILFFNDKMFHPSFYTLSPIIGICLIIWFSHKDELITKILSSKLFVGVGLISYSLYLWHYPIFAFARVIDFAQNDITKKIFLGIIILLLSILSYFFIERPARNKSNNFKIIFLLLSIFLSVLILVNSLIVFKNGFRERMPEIINKNLTEPSWMMLTDDKGEKCWEKSTYCKYNDISQKKVFLIGDSHMASIAKQLKDKLVNKGYQVIVDFVIYYPGFDIINNIGKIDKRNKNKVFELQKIINQNDNNIIIFLQRFPLHFSGKFFDNLEGGTEQNEIWDYKFVPFNQFDTVQHSFFKSVSELSYTNQIVLIYPMPEVGWHVPNQILIKILAKYRYDQLMRLVWKIFLPFRKVNEIKDYLITKNYITTSYKVYKDRVKSSFDVLDSIKGENIYRVYPHKLFCDTLIKDRCVTHDDKNIFYSDDEHLSFKGTEMINELILKEIEKIEAKSN